MSLYRNPRKDRPPSVVAVKIPPRRPALSLAEVLQIQGQRQALVAQIRRTLRRKAR